MGVVGNILAFEIQSIQIIDCNLSVGLTESKHLKMTKAIQIIEL